MNRSVYQTMGSRGMMGMEESGLPYSDMRGLKSGAPISRPSRRQVERTASAVSQTGLWVLVIFLLLLAATAFTLALITFIRTNDRHKGLSSRIHDAREASLPVGFSVYKNVSQSINDSTATTLVEWSYSDGYPAYDASSGAFDTQTGVFTTALEAYYIVTGTVCFYTQSPNGSVEVHLMTNGSSSSIVYNRQRVDVVIDGAQCLGVHQNMWLPVASRVWLMVLTYTGVDELVATESQFGVEKIAI